MQKVALEHHPAAGRPEYTSPLLAREEERALAARWRKSQDTEALQKLILANTRLVIGFALPYRPYARLDDLVQEGHLGLTVAAQRFDPGRGTRFATYAGFWIRAYILNYLFRDHSQVTMNKGEAVSRLFFGLTRTTRNRERMGKTVDDKSLAKQFGAKPEVVVAVRQRLARQDVSLDAAMPKSGKTVGEFIGDNAPTPEENVADTEERLHRLATLKRALAKLNALERKIILQRWFRQRPIPLDALGERYGISHEWVRQIEKRALKKLRAYAKTSP